MEFPQNLNLTVVFLKYTKNVVFSCHLEILISLFSFKISEALVKMLLFNFIHYSGSHLGPKIQNFKKSYLKHPLLMTSQYLAVQYLMCRSL